MESPCIGVCKLNENQVCIGCHRTLEEIANWSAQTKTEKNPMTAPLPYVSQAACDRVTDALPPPTECNNCGGPVDLVNNAVIYGREYGEWPYAYRCTQCDSHIGLHIETDIPLGTLADKATRLARRTHKPTFFALQWEKSWSRTEAYTWLAEQMGLPRHRCHWGQFTAEQAQQAGALCQAAIDNHPCKRSPQ